MSLKTTIRFIGRPLKIVFCGLENAGKTAMYLRLKTGEFHPNLKPTISTTMDKIDISTDNDSFSATIIDLGGQKRLRNQWSSHITTADVLIFVIDSNDKHKMSETKKEFFDKVNPVIKKKLCIMCCNKFDLLNNKSSNEVIEEMKIFMDLEDSNLKSFICTSQKTGYGIPKITKFLRNEIKAD